MTKDSDDWKGEHLIRKRRLSKAEELSIHNAIQHKKKKARPPGFLSHQRILRSIFKNRTPDADS